MSKEAQPEFKDVFVVHTTVDEYGRLGEVVAVTSTKKLAETMAEGQGWYGGTGSIQEREAIIIGKQAYVLTEGGPYELDKDLKNHLEKMKIKALKKLTKAERRLLGVEEDDLEDEK